LLLRSVLHVYENLCVYFDSGNQLTACSSDYLEDCY
jgi:hypothetical protein